jgi:tetratricopeptide (TPR) repeat protein
MEGLDTLAVLDFGTLFQSLVQTLRTGTLKVSSGDHEKFLFVNCGKVEAVYTSRSRFLLGRILVSMRALNDNDLRKVLDEQRSSESPLPLGESLLQAGMITEDVLSEAVRYQMMEELLEVFYWESPRYLFFPGPIREALPTVPRELTRVGESLAVDDILLYVTKTMDDVSRFQDVIPSLRDVYEQAVKPGRLKNLPDHTPDDDEIFKLLDGRRSVSELFAELSRIQYEVMERLLVLRKAEYITPLDGRRLLHLAVHPTSGFTPDRRHSLLLRARELGVKDPELWAEVARVLAEMGETDLAGEEWLAYGRRVLAGGDTKKALHGAEEALKLVPGNLSALEFRLSVEVSLGRESRQAEVLAEIGELYARAGRTKEAVEAFDRAVLLSPRDERILEVRAENFAAAGISKAACRAFVSLGTLRARIGNMREAEQALYTALRHNPASVRARNALIGVHLETGRPDAAADELKDLAPLLLTAFDDRCDMAVDLLQALKERLVKSRYAAEDVMLVLAEACVQCDETGLAVKVLRESIRARQRKGDFEGAAESVRRVLLLRPNNVALLRQAAGIHSRRGDPLAAAVQYRKLGLIFKKCGDLERQEEAVRSLLKSAPYDEAAITNLADLLTGRGAEAEAAEQWSRLGYLHRAAGRVDRAVECFDRACTMAGTEVRHGKALASALEEALNAGRSVGSHLELLSLLERQGDHPTILAAGLRLLERDDAPEEVREAVLTSHREIGKRLEAVKQ